MKNNKRKRSIWIGIIIALVIALLVAIVFIVRAGTVNYLTPEEFLKMFINGKILPENISIEQLASGDSIITGRFIQGNSYAQFKFVLSSNVMGSGIYEAIKSHLNESAAQIKVQSAWMGILSSFAPMLILILFYIWIFSSMSKGGAGGMLGGQKQKPRQVKSNVKFSDIAGINEEKAELMELVDYLKKPEKYAAHGARVPKGVLMEGPPGTGKTLLAKAVAGEAGVAFFSMAGSEFEEMFVGLGASRVRDLFGDAKKAAPCIIFIDEIDAVGRKRNSSMGSGTTEQTLNQLLVEMDGFEINSGVIVMAATNRADVLDSALLRPGRFDRTIQISLPDIRERADILKLHARNKSVSPKIDWKNIAERTPGFSGAQLENVLNEAAILVVREDRKIIELTDIDEAIDRVVGGPAKKSRAMTLHDKDVVSYHEAGHALIGMKLASASKVQKVTIIPRGSAGGYTIMTPKDESNFSSIEDLKATITGYMGGRAAEEIMFGKNKVTTGAHDDLDKATNIARRMITQFGMSELGLTKFVTMQEEAAGYMKGTYSDVVAAKIDAELGKILNNSYDEAIKIINANKPELELIAESLRVLETITSEQIEYIDKHMKLPEEVIKEKESRSKKEEEIKNGDLIELSPEDID